MRGKASFVLHIARAFLSQRDLQTPYTTFYESQLNPIESGGDKSKLADLSNFVRVFQYACVH
jgi:hypothetical protein